MADTGSARLDPRRLAQASAALAKLEQARARRQATAGTQFGDLARRSHVLRELLERKMRAAAASNGNQPSRPLGSP